MDEDSEVKEIAVALSGGGHRATLFSLGVLMALVDLGLNDEVSQIASVSGGSITNAFVGWRCNFAAADRAEFDAVAKDLIARIVQRGVITKGVEWTVGGVLFVLILSIIYVSGTGFESVIFCVSTSS